MKFKLKTTADIYSPEQFKKYKKLGFRFKKDPSSTYNVYVITNEPEIKINSLEELVNLSIEFGELTIYDNTIEM